MVRRYLIVAFALFLSLIGPVWAQDKKISQLPAASTLTGTELIACVQGGVTDQCTASQLSTFTLGGTWHGSIIDVAHGGTGTSSPSLIGGTNVTITGSWPNQTIAAAGGSGSGTVTSVAESFTGGIISVAGSPITTSGTFALTVAGTSGGIPYFSSGTGWASSAALASGSLVVGGGAGSAPATITLGGDCTFSSPNVTCTKTSGVAFTALATAATPLSVANGGTGTASPGLVAGTNITITGAAWPNQTINSTASGGALPGVGFLVGNWYTSLFHIPATTGATGTGNEYCSPFILQADPNNASFTTDQVALDITTLFSGGNVQYGLRAPGTGANTGLPGTLLGNTASQSTTTTGVFGVAWASNFSVSTGHGYWLCRQVDNSTAALEGLTVTGGQQVAFMGSTTAAATITSPQVDLLATETFGTWTANGASLTWVVQTSNRSVWGALHVTSIP